MRVLIIDDDRAHGEALADLLASRGHEAYFAPDLDEADWLLGLFRFQLALIDCDMPGRSGHDVATKLAERDPETRLVLMSAREAHREACQRRAFPFLAKPIGVDALTALIGQWSAGTSLVRRLSFPIAPKTSSNAPPRSPSKPREDWRTDDAD